MTYIQELYESCKYYEDFVEKQQKAAQKIYEELKDEYPELVVVIHDMLHGHAQNAQYNVRQFLRVMEEKEKGFGSGHSQCSEHVNQELVERCKSLEKKMDKFLNYLSYE